MDKDTFDIAMKLNHHRLIVKGDVITLKNKNNWYKRVCIRSCNNEGFYVLPIVSESSGKIPPELIYYDEFLDQFCF